MLKGFWDLLTALSRDCFVIVCLVIVCALEEEFVLEGFVSVRLAGEELIVKLSVWIGVVSVLMRGIVVSVNRDFFWMEEFVKLVMRVAWPVLESLIGVWLVRREVSWLGVVVKGVVLRIVLNVMSLAPDVILDILLIKENAVSVIRIV